MNRLTLGIVALALVLSPIAAFASSSDDVDAQLKAMQERMSRLENKLQATTDELDAANSRLSAQQDVISRVESDQAASSGLSSFLDTVEINGWMAASYNYNFAGRDSGALGNANTGNVSGGGTGAGFYYPFQPDTNTVSLDQFWLEIERPVTQENRAGFRADLAYGKTADILNGINDGVSGSQNDFNLYQAYVQYLAPIGNGITFKAGKFATLIGAEVAQAPYNYNITRGQIYNLFQPITNVGVVAGTSVGGLDVNLGFVTDTRSAIDTEVDNNKALIGSIGQSTDGYDWQIAGTWGTARNTQYFGGTIPNPNAPAQAGKAGDKEMIIDAIVKVRPMDKLEAYVNADYLRTEFSAVTPGVSNENGWGVAVASRYAFTDRLGLAVRGEYFDIQNFSNISSVSLFASPTFIGGGNDFNGYGVTTTMDYKLAEGLTLKGEVRYDRANEAFNNGGLTVPKTANDNDIFSSSGSGTHGKEDQLVGAVQVIYSF